MSALTAGCWAGGPRRPLFGGGESEPAPAVERPAAPPPRPYARTPEEALLERLRAPSSAEERGAVLDELVRRGEAAAPVLEAALEEELVLVDLLAQAQERVRGEPPSEVARRAVQAEWVADKYRLALDRYAHGDVYGALRLVDAILALEPDAHLADRLRRLRRRATSKLLRDSVLVADVVPEAGGTTSGEAVRATLHLENLSEETIALRTGPQETLGFLTVSYEVLAPDGRHTRLQTQRTIHSDDLVLEPGEAVEVPLELPDTHRSLDPGLVGRYHLAGNLRPHTLLVGEAPYSLFVPLLPGEVVVVAPSDRDLIDAPDAAFLEAVDAGLSGPFEARPQAARRAFTAAVLMAQEDRQAAVAAVATALEAAEGALSEALCAALGRITGEPLGFTRAEWLRWWRTHQARPQALEDEPR